MTVDEWIRERLENCQRIAGERTGDDRRGWLEDADYFQQILDRLCQVEALSRKVHQQIEDWLCDLEAIKGDPLPGDPQQTVKLVMSSMERYQKALLAGTEQPSLAEKEKELAAWVNGSNAKAFDSASKE